MQRIGRVLRFGAEPGAVVDERPAAPRDLRRDIFLVAFGFLLGALVATSAWFFRLESLAGDRPAKERIYEHGEPVRR